MRPEIAIIQCGTLSQFFLETVSKCTQTQQADANKSKNFWEEVHALSAPATSGYITGNAFTRDSTVILKSTLGGQRACYATGKRL